MNTAEITYESGLRTAATHLRSGESLNTDAPTDNNGKGEAFSPTDLTATSLVSCMLTMMGILAERKGINMGSVQGTVKKVMAEAPRRIAQLKVEVTFAKHNMSMGDRQLMEQTAINCPVAKSLHPDIVQQVKFKYE